MNSLISYLINFLFNPLAQEFEYVDTPSTILRSIFDVGNVLVHIDPGAFLSNTFD